MYGIDVRRTWDRIELVILKVLVCLGIPFYAFGTE